MSGTTIIRRCFCTRLHSAMVRVSRVGRQSPSRVDHYETSQLRRSRNQLSLFALPSGCGTVSHGGPSAIDVEPQPKPGASNRGKRAQSHDMPTELGKHRTNRGAPGRIRTDNRTLLGGPPLPLGYGGPTLIPSGGGMARDCIDIVRQFPLPVYSSMTPFLSRNAECNRRPVDINGS